jgi:N-acetylmuramoyl-L-alanine amidase
MSRRTPFLTRLLLALFIAAWGAAASPAFAEPARIAAVRTGDSLGFQVVIDVERRVDPQVFVLDEPMRLVVDLGDARWGLSQASQAQGAVAGWRYGRRDGQAARLVVDLAVPALVKRIGYDLGAPRGVSRLVVDLEPASREAFAGNVQPWRRTSELLRDVYTPPEGRPPPPIAVARPPVPPVATPPQTAAATPQSPASAVPAIRPPPAVVAPTPPVEQPAAGAAAAVPPPAERSQVPTIQLPAVPQVAAAPPAAAVPARRGSALRPPGKRVVVIDPGHGGQDPGAIGATGTYEKNVTLQVSRDIKRQLESTGRYRVLLTRDRDVFLRLRERVQKARDWKADLFISVHADSIGTTDLRGASIYTLSDTASDAVAAALAARENRADIIAGVDLSQESREVANILIDLAQRETMNNSASFAHILVRELGREIRLQSVKPHRFAGFAVLKAPDVPAVLMELGYLSNRQDESLLKQAAHRRRVALGVQRAIDAFFGAPPNR